MVSRVESLFEAGVAFEVAGEHGKVPFRGGIASEVGLFGKFGRYIEELSLFNNGDPVFDKCMTSAENFSR